MMCRMVLSIWGTSISSGSSVKVSVRLSKAVGYIAQNIMDTVSDGACICNVWRFWKDARSRPVSVCSWLRSPTAFITRFSRHGRLETTLTKSGKLSVNVNVNSRFAKRVNSPIISSNILPSSPDRFSCRTFFELQASSCKKKAAGTSTHSWMSLMIADVRLGEFEEIRNKSNSFVESRCMTDFTWIFFSSGNRGRSRARARNW